MLQKLLARLDSYLWHDGNDEETRIRSSAVALAACLPKGKKRCCASRYLPSRQLAPEFPSGLEAWLSASWWLINLTATHLLGVALPEETFYRGYLLPRLEQRWPPKTRIFGAFVGRAVIVSSALFALGHFLGEWNPLRLGPFIPSLIFAWQRNKTGSIWGAVIFHAACNIFGQLLFQLYAPI